MAKLILMVGNIGTGKTTTVNKLMAGTAHYDNQDTVVVSADDLATMLANGHYGSDIWTNRHIHLYSAAKQHIIREAFTHGFDVIVDGTHMGKINRKVYIDIANEFDAHITVYLHTYPNGLNRRISNPKSKHHSVKVWTEIHGKFANMYEEPTLDEGINSIIEVSGVNSNGQ